MVQAETKYKLFRKIFNRRLKQEAKPGNEAAEPPETCSEDEIERTKVRKLQLALKAQRNHLIQLKKLEENPKSRYDHIVTNGIFGIFCTLTVFSMANLIHTVFLFDSFPSDPLDPFRSVMCEREWCTVRTYFDLEPPSIVRILFWLVVGIMSLLLSIRSFVSVETTGLLIHAFSAVLFSATWIVKRQRHYTQTREPL